MKLKKKKIKKINLIKEQYKVMRNVDSPLDQCA